MADMKMESHMSLQVEELKLLLVVLSLQSTEAQSFPMDFFIAFSNL